MAPPDPRYLWAVCGHSFKADWAQAPWPSDVICPIHGLTGLWAETDYPEKGAPVLPLPEPVYAS